MANQVQMKIFRGDANGGELVDYQVEVDEGMVVLDVVHKIQAEAGAGSVLPLELQSRQVRLVLGGNQRQAEADVHDADGHVPARRSRSPFSRCKTFPMIHDLVTDVSWNYEVNKKIPPFKPQPKRPDGTWRMQQYEVDRVQEFRKCIECFLCQNVCHVLRNSAKFDEFFGPRFMVRLASLEMHPLDVEDRHRS